MGFEQEFEPNKTAVCPHCQSTKFIIQEAAAFYGFQDPENPGQINVTKIKTNEVDWILCEKCNKNITLELAQIKINFP